MRCEKDDTDEPFVPRTTPARRRTTMRTDMTESTSLNPPTTPDMTTPSFTTPGITRQFHPTRIMFVLVLNLAILPMANLLNCNLGYY